MQKENGWNLGGALIFYVCHSFEFLLDSHPLWNGQASRGLRLDGGLVGLPVPASPLPSM